MTKTSLLSIVCMLAAALCGRAAKPVTIYSPDKQLCVEITAGEVVSVRVVAGEQLLFEIGDIHLDTDQGIIPARKAGISKVSRSSVDRTVVPVIREKRAQISECYNEATLQFSDRTNLQLRLFNEGLAYRWITKKKGDLCIYNEGADFLFDEASVLTLQEDGDINSAYEEPYQTKTLRDIKAGTTANFPALLKTPTGVNVLFLESDVVDYPCMWLKKGERNLQTHFWGYPKSYNVKGNSYNRRKVTATENYIAKTAGSREFPWRVFAVAREDKGLISNQLVYLLAPECKIKDTSWIHPGWVTFDWWARRGLYGVDFKAGINTATAKYMVDFAADFGIRYFLFDDGWTYKEDLTRAIDGLDIKEVVDYAKTKGVDVMLWVTYDLFDSQMEKAMKQFAEWGIKGLKIDFINRSDQEANNFYWRAAEVAAQYRMVLDFHGAYRPDGMRRAYPNVLTREALVEFEQSGGRDYENPDHHCMLPFIRNVAGPMDYIPGTMNNATKSAFRHTPQTPMGQGTRAHFMALAVIDESPMQMLPDPQSDYYREAECTRFLTSIPVEWDETIPLHGKLGDYVALARQSGEQWYVAGVTDWTPRKLEVTLDFLPAGRSYTMELFRDGVNADIRAIDYKREVRTVKSGDTLVLDMAPGGGWVARIYE